MDATAERVNGDHADRSHPDDKNEKVAVQEHADAEDLYRDISIPNAEEELNGYPTNGKRSSTYV
jgi:hypothetical protein